MEAVQCFTSICADQPYAVPGADPFPVCSIHGNALHLFIAEEIAGKIIGLHYRKNGFTACIAWLHPADNE